MKTYSYVIWDELDNYVSQLGADRVHCEEQYLVEMLKELHGWEPRDTRTHVKSWLVSSTRKS